MQARALALPQIQASVQLDRAPAEQFVAVQIQSLTLARTLPPLTVMRTLLLLMMVMMMPVPALLLVLTLLLRA